MSLDLAILLTGIYWNGIIDKTVKDFGTMTVPISGDSPASAVGEIR